MNLPRALQQFSLEKTTGIVTGGSSGLGLAIAEAASAAGATVHALSRTGHPKPPVSAETQSGLALHHHAVDVTDERVLRDTIERVGEKEGIDFLVCAAGITERRPFSEGASEQWRRIQAVNVDAAAVAARAAYPFLMRSRHPGRLVCVTSLASRLGFEGVVPYAASKAALLGLVRGLAVEWASAGILVNAIAPGWFPTAMTAQVMDDARRQKILARMPLHRFGRAEELAGAVVFLLSPAATYITGHELAVDGGALAFGF